MGREKGEHLSAELELETLWDWKYTKMHVYGYLNVHLLVRAYVFPSPAH